MSEPVTLLVTVEIVAERAEEFKDIMAFDAAESVTKENGGCLRFDVLELPSASGNKFLFYEVYANSEALEFHKGTPHFAKWNEFKESGGVVNVSVEFPKSVALGIKRF